MKTLVKKGSHESWGKFEIDVIENNSLKEIHFLDKNFKHHYLKIPIASTRNFAVKAIIAELYPNEDIEAFTFN